MCDFKSCNLKTFFFFFFFYLIVFLSHNSDKCILYKQCYSDYIGHFQIKEIQIENQVGEIKTLKLEMLLAF